MECAAIVTRAQGRPQGTLSMNVRWIFRTPESAGWYAAGFAVCMAP